MFKCLNIQMFQCSNHQMLKCSDFHSVHCQLMQLMWLKQYQCNRSHKMLSDADWLSNVQMFKCSMFNVSNVPMFQCSNIPMFKCSNVQMFKCSNGQMVQWSNVRMFRYSNVQLLWLFSSFFLLKCYIFQLVLGGRCVFRLG